MTTDPVTVNSLSADDAGNGGDQLRPIESPPAPPTPPPDSIGVDYLNGATVLRIIQSGEIHNVPLTTRQGGLYVTIGDHEYEVHTLSDSYIVIANGQAYELDDDPTTPGWPFDHPAPNIDITPYVEPPPPPPKGDADEELGESLGSRYLEGDGDDSSKFSDPTHPAPTDEMPIEDTLPPDLAPVETGDDAGETLPGDDTVDS